MDQQATTSEASKEGSVDTPEGLYRFLTKICEDGPVSYFHVVLDPTSFGGTVENIYNVSCLANEGKVSVYKDGTSGLPVLNTLSQSNHPSDSIESETQFVISMNMDLWKELIESFDIKEPMLKIN